MVIVHVLMRVKMADVLTNDSQEAKSICRGDLWEWNSLVAWERRDAYLISTFLQQRIAILWTQGQNAYASIVRITRAEDGMNGIDSQPKCLCVEERKRKRRQWVTKRVVEALVAMYNTLHLANVCMWLCVYLGFFFVSSPVSCLVHSAFLFECTQSNRSVAEPR